MSGAAYRDIDIVVSCVAIGVIGSQMLPAGGFEKPLIDCSFA